MLDLEIVPEISLGTNDWEFVLGMYLSQAIAIIQSQVDTIKGVELLYSDTNPLGVDVIINLPQHGFRLIFDPTVQRLKTIEVFNMNLVKLKYAGVYFNSPEVLPSIEQIEYSFGATKLGEYDADNQLYTLHFRGLSFYFPVDNTLHDDYAHGLRLLVLLNGTSPVVSKMLVYAGSNVAAHRIPPLPFSCYNRQIYLELATVLRSSLGKTSGLKMKLFTESSARSLQHRHQCFTKEVLFGDSCQEVTQKLGAPNRIYFKGDDRMNIYSSVNPPLQRSEMFFNYFTFGIDILFDASTQLCKKFVLHTNYPGHYNFNTYQRCEFQLLLQPRLLSDNTANMSLKPPESINISTYSKWDEISAALSPPDRPVVVHRIKSTTNVNPFGSTFFYGYQDIIFEVMPNNHIASITLYNRTSTPAKSPDNSQDK